jgi:NAD+ synthase (glutamine-hydrolysing)
MRLAVVQMDTKLGDLEANLEKHLAFIAQASSQGADVVVFPELSLTGYSLQDLAADVALRPDPAEPIFARLLEASQGIDLLFGFAEQDPRHRFYVSAAYLSQGEILHIHRKVYLPTYGLFQEGRFFAWGDRVRAFDTRFGRVGILICEDFWHASSPYLLWLDGADLLIFLSASPSRGLRQADQLGSAEWVERLNQSYASLFTVFVAHSNRVGYEDGLRFGGRATVFDPDGERIAAGQYHEEGLTVADLDLNQLRRTRTRLPLLRDERTGLVQRELERILVRKGR